MTEGWYFDDYLVLLSLAERSRAAENYRLAEYLPDSELLGLRNWDDFILRSHSGEVFCAPTVPLCGKYSSPYSLPESRELTPDSRIAGKIKWYVKPLIFGGSATEPANTAWVSHEQHAQLVVWWNEQYQSLASASSAA